MAHWLGTLSEEISGARCDKAGIRAKAVGSIGQEAGPSNLGDPARQKVGPRDPAGYDAKERWG